MLPVEIVTRPAQLGAITRELAGARTIALDTESNSFHHYPEQLCLIQIASRHKVYIIDTISLYDLDPLRDVLAGVSIMKVIHGADYLSTITSVALITTMALSPFLRCILEVVSPAYQRYDFQTSNFDHYLCHYLSELYLT